MSADTHTLPRTLEAGDGGYTLRTIAADDGPELLKFARNLPVHDLLYLRRDIRHEKVTEAWLAGVADGHIDTLVAESDGRIVGTAALLRDPLSWSPHLGEVRVLVAEDARGTGLGRALIQEIFLLAANSKLVKLTARMTVDQKGAIAIFEELGFRGEALLKDHVLDEAGASHDLVILACNIDQAGRVHAAFVS
jgi:GNAT superfamily N-acetyltransferase